MGPCIEKCRGESGQLSDNNAGNEDHENEEVRYCTALRQMLGKHGGFDWLRCLREVVDGFQGLTSGGCMFG